MACLKGIEHWQEYYVTICVRTELFLKATENMIKLIHAMIKKINKRNSINPFRHKTREAVDDPEQIEENMDETCHCNSIYKSVEETLEEIRLRTSNLMGEQPLLGAYVLRALREEVHLLIDRLEKTNFNSPTEIYTLCKAPREHKFTLGLKKRKKR